MIGAIFIGIGAICAWVSLFIWNWKVALALFIIRLADQED